MKWSAEAEAALAKIPFFVRNRVRHYVQNEAEASHASIVTLTHVEFCRKRFFQTVHEEIKGYRIETCFASSGCPNSLLSDELLVPRIELLVQSKRLRDALLSRVDGELKFHHEMQIVVAGCPNACSRPQVADIGLIGASLPYIRSSLCNQCKKCVAACIEHAVDFRPKKAAYPEINSAICVACGQCCKVCHTGTIISRRKGYRILIGGKLGRHPQLGKEISGIYTDDEVITVIHAALAFYLDNMQFGERFGDILNRAGYAAFINFLKAKTFDLSQGDC
jgi:dissimilatory sulfite reductase (desulfoviridin) alpha/beta subunit